MNYSDEEKIKRLLDAQEHPEHYTDEELCEIIRDARPLAQLKRALAKERAEDEDIDVEKAWKAFSQSHPESSHPLSRHRIPRWLRVAAVFLGCVLLAGVTFAAMTRLGWIQSPFAAEKPEVAQHAPVTAALRDTTATADSITPKQETKKPAPVVKVFDNTTLSDILSAMGQYYGLKVVYSTATAKAIRLHFEWDQAKSVDANIAILNGFQQISITRNGDTLNVE
ncbi:DUF4974 domain-containing protein [Hallella mizrahii]|uniref:DUF4974 domain-containing protein n=1 Tax=Hallella mizrahii TaxID=2606637 RepID=A0A7K0KG81_9BACT|nr:DUF4974 domain-containing protein [Hallella mizrahii]MST84933.1 DUF4974 domain-containing protein [Hallella mizrahii]